MTFVERFKTALETFKRIGNGEAEYPAQLVRQDGRTYAVHETAMLLSRLRELGIIDENGDIDRTSEGLSSEVWP